MNRFENSVRSLEPYYMAIIENIVEGSRGGVSGQIVAVFPKHKYHTPSWEDKEIGDYQTSMDDILRGFHQRQSLERLDSPIQHYVSLLTFDQD